MSLGHAESGTAGYYVQIDNEPPIVSDVWCCFRDSGSTYSSESCVMAAGSWTPSEGTNYDMLCNFTVTDINGYQDMQDGWVYATWHHEYVAWNSGLDFDSRYENSSCSPISGTGSGNSIGYACEFKDIKYWADGGLWTFLINLSDGNELGEPHKTTIRINNITTIWQTPSIDFGSMGLGQEGSESNPGYAGQRAVTNNTGNTRIMIEVSAIGQKMECSLGEITLSNIRYDMANGVKMDDACGKLTAYPLWDPDCHAKYGENLLNDCSGDCPGLTSLSHTYWGVKIPHSGVAGTCRLQVLFMATQG